jgi:cobalt-zinc-cadmium efflux system membrane fusion protein
MSLGRRTTIGAKAAIGAAAALLCGWVLTACSGAKKTDAGAAAPAAAQGAPTVELSANQLQLVKIETAGQQAFAETKDAVGNIDFDEDRSVQVFSPYQGKIISALVQLGDRVSKGQPLYTIESPDLMNAASTLISAAGVEDMSLKALERGRSLHETKGISDQNLEQLVSAEITSDAALKAARDAVKVFGKSDADVDQMIRLRKVDPVLVVRSPISGVVTARNAQPGLLVQPGGTPAPYSVADTSTMWMLADATEADSEQFRLGQPVEVSVMALPGRTFQGKIVTIGPSVDPNVHTLQMRSEIADPQHLLKSGMLANFVIRTGQPIQGVALPADAVVREGDGTMTVWVTADRQHFTQRKVQIGLQRDGFDQILDGVRPGELVVSTGAVFLDNMLTAQPDDD